MLSRMERFSKVMNLLRMRQMYSVKKLLKILKSSYIFLGRPRTITRNSVLCSKRMTEMSMERSLEQQMSLCLCAKALCRAILTVL